MDTVTVVELIVLSLRFIMSAVVVSLTRLSPIRLYLVLFRFKRILKGVMFVVWIASIPLR